MRGESTYSMGGCTIPDKHLSKKKLAETKICDTAVALRAVATINMATCNDIQNTFLVLKQGSLL